MIKTDFSNVERLLLVYPEDISEEDYNYNSLIPLYDELLTLIPPEIQVIIFVKSKRVGQRIKELRRNLTYIAQEELLTIWLRDVAGFNFGPTIVKPIFRPNYYRGDFQRADKINTGMEVIHQILSKKMVKIPIVWDGGNLVTNGKFAVITERLFKDNPNYSHDRIAGIIREFLEIAPVFIPELRGDPLGHADGYCAFIDEDHALVSQYPDTWYGRDRKYIENIKKELSGRDITVIPMKENPEDDYCYASGASKIPIARGIYINLLQLNDLFILPEFKYEPVNGEQNPNVINTQTLEQFGKVVSINCDYLAMFGGGLHCVSFVD